MSRKDIILVILVFLVAFGLRVYGIDWDQGQHLHPDERFLTMVADRIQLPSSLSQYLDTSSSPLNPYNYEEYQFFVYGTFPLFLVRYVAQLVNMTEYHQVHLVGRTLSALVDSLNVFVLTWITIMVFRSVKGLGRVLPAFIYTLAVFPIQQSHFFTVDTYLTHFMLLTFALMIYFVTTKKWWPLPLAGLTFGLALACKISAANLSPLIFFLFLYLFLTKASLKHFFRVTAFGLLFTLFAFISLRFFQPYSFAGLIKPNPLFISNLATLSTWNNSSTLFPPSIQWLSKSKWLFPLQNMVFWGIGLPATILLLLLVFKSIFFYRVTRLRLRTPSFPGIFLTLTGFWVFLFFLYQGNQFILTQRYFLPIYPFICLLIAGMYLCFSLHRLVFKILLTSHVILAISFLSIYSRPHTRVQASQWIYQNIPPQSVISSEYWDDPLPLLLPDYPTDNFQSIALYPYDPDSEEKMAVLYSSLDKLDYLILSSNRLWSSIPPVPDRYPLTTLYYQQLFDGQLSFQKIKEFNSYPGFFLPFLKHCLYIGPTNYPYRQQTNSFFETDPSCSHPGIYFRDDTAEEAFTVYDHPKVIIFKKD